MREEVVQGHSLEEIRQDWAFKLKLSPEDITLEVIEKPGFFSRQWKVRLIWDDQSGPNLVLPSSQAVWDGSKYVIVLGEGVKQFRPFLLAGEVWFNGKRQDKPFRVSFGERVEFLPNVSVGQLTWDLQILHQGLSVIVKVKHELPGHYSLGDFPTLEEIDLKQYVTWQSLPSQGKIWDEEKLKLDLEQLKVVHGFRPESWSEIMSVKGVGEVVVAEATLPVLPEHAQLVDLVGSPQMLSDTGEESVDYFASKVQLVEEGAVLARKIPGKPGVPGKDVFGKILPAAGFKDFQFRLKKNVYLSVDGLEVVAACGGQPVRLDERTYMVENVYVLHKDVELATGSINFPGDVFVNGNVQDGLHVFAGGKLEIKGSVSHAEIRAEKGVKIYQNLVGGKVTIGGKFVVRSKLLRSVSELRDQLSVCLQMTAELIKAPGAINFKPGQCLKLVMERQFPDLPKLASSVEKFVLENKDDELITQGFIVSIRTSKHFLAGLGPLDLQAVPFLQRVDQALEQFIEKVSVEVPEKLSLVVSYVQSAVIECGGSFECTKGVYNSNIRVEGDIVIEGVCRGGKIFAGGQVRIGELGGSGVSSTFVQISSDSRLSVKYCHPNVIIAVGKEIIQIEEAYRQLEIYRENGFIQVEKVRANPL
ncbi:FapA family protein [Desulfosporosinus sp. OT]|uniref:DUF342 domain-containing protein n=1 Tax=Desulfosporosinus sp. OT TaxID=913865 RepID=UPI000223B136|nr:FapA family protein [Desulfosporosinus sp. OT]EGW36744.1 hypothetical protein DOT_5324 [Desulfosporosinus sp. OT]